MWGVSLILGIKNQAASILTICHKSFIHYSVQGHGWGGVGWGGVANSSQCVNTARKTSRHTHILHSTGRLESPINPICMSRDWGGGEVAEWKPPSTSLFHPLMAIFMKCKKSQEWSQTEVKTMHQSEANRAGCFASVKCVFTLF